MRKRSRIYAAIRKARYFLLAGASVGAGYLLGHYHPSFTLNTAGPSLFHSALPTALKQETVMVLGGSAAYGWADPSNNSYLRRAFQTLTDTTNTEYLYDDRTQVGGDPAALHAKTVASWLSSDRPQVVVISWGLLNDVSHQTPITQFKQAIHAEVAASLKFHAVVIFVTPPVVDASLNNPLFDQYLKAQYLVAQSFHSKNLYWLNLYDDMSEYLQVHGQDLYYYTKGTWHPNTAGHQLAGELLFNELIETFGSKALEFHAPGNLIAHLTQQLNVKG